MRSTLLAVVVAVSLPLSATEPNPSTRQRELVLKLFEVTNSERATLAMMDAIFVEMEKQFLQTAEAQGNRPEAVAEAREMFAAFREKTAKIDIAALIQEPQIRLYSKYFTEKELEDLLAFYATPAGRKTIEVLPDLTREAMEMGVRELSPKIGEVMNEVMAEHEKKRPWRRTMSDIRKVATALEAYATDNDELYPTGDYASLKELLSPEYLETLPEKDIWGHPYAYIVSTDRRHYRIVSAGADSIFEWDSRRIAPTSDNDVETPIRYRDRLEDDVIFADYAFVQLPVQAKPEMEE